MGVYVCVYVCGFVEVFSSSADLVCMWKREVCVCVYVGSWKCLLRLPRWCVCVRERQREYVYMCVCGFVKLSLSSADVVCVGETWVAMGRGDPQKQNKISTTF